MSHTDFSLISTQGHVEKVEQAIAEVLRGNAELDAFFDSRIYVIPESAEWPDFLTPFLTVSAVSEGETFTPNGEGETRLLVEIAVWYEEQRERVPKETYGETVESYRTIRSLIQHLKVVLAGNSKLEGTSISVTKLADRIIEFQTVPFPARTLEDGSTQLLMQLLVVYEYLVDIDTGAPI